MIVEMEITFFKKFFVVNYQHWFEIAKFVTKPNRPNNWTDSLETSYLPHLKRKMQRIWLTVCGKIIWLNWHVFRAFCEN